MLVGVSAATVDAPMATFTNRGDAAPRLSLAEVGPAYGKALPPSATFVVSLLPTDGGWRIACRGLPPLCSPATVEATEEAVLNALWSAEDMTVRLVHRVRVLPHDDVLALLADHRRLAR